MNHNYYNLAFSFAGEDRGIVSQIADRFKSHKPYRIFYDEWFSSELLGKSLTEEFSGIYGHPKTIIIVFVSQYYLNKEWTIYERRSVIEGKFREDSKLVIPVILDRDVVLPGIPTKTVGYIDFEVSGLEGTEKLIRETLVKNIHVDDDYVEGLCNMANSEIAPNFGFEFFSSFSDSIHYVNQSAINKALSNLIHRKMNVRAKACVAWFEDFSGIGSIFGKTEEGEIFGFSWADQTQAEIMEKLVIELGHELSSLTGNKVTLDVEDSWSCEEYIEGAEYFFSNPKTGFIHGLVLPGNAVVGVRKSANNSIQPTANASAD